MDEMDLQQQFKEADRVRDFKLAAYFIIMVIVLGHLFNLSYLSSRLDSIDKEVSTIKTVLIMQKYMADKQKDE